MPTVIIPGRYENLTEISSLVREAAQNTGLNDFAIYAVETAVDEACSNIIEHAYGGEDKGDIEFSFDITDVGLKITLVDHGKPFDPDKVPIPDLKGHLRTRKTHGLGLYIMRQWMDEVKFKFEEGKNTLTMLKLRNPKN